MNTSRHNKNILSCLKNRKNATISTEQRRVFNSYVEEQLAMREKIITKCNLPETTRTTFLVAFSPDGNKIASTHGDHTIRITDLNTCRCIDTLIGHPRTPWSITFHPSNSNLLASGCLGGMVRVWNLTTGKTKVYTPSNGRPIASLAFHPVDMVLLIATGNQLECWNWQQAKPFTSVSTRDPQLSVKLVKFNKTGDRLLTGVRNPLNLSLFGLRWGSCNAESPTSRPQRGPRTPVRVLMSDNQTTLRSHGNEDTPDTSSSIIQSNDTTQFCPSDNENQGTVENERQNTRSSESSRDNCNLNEDCVIVNQQDETMNRDTSHSHRNEETSVQVPSTSAQDNESVTDRQATTSQDDDQNENEEQRVSRNRTIFAQTHTHVAQIPRNIQAGIDYIIAEGFAASGYSIGMASNLTYTTYQLQLWDFTNLDLPNIADSYANVIVKRCKISNDASVDISSDGRLLCAIVPNLGKDLTFGSICVFSLEKHNKGQCLFSRKFCLNAISVSLSPLGQYLLVGMASLRTFFISSSVTMAQIFKLNNATKTMHHVSNLKSPNGVQDLSIGTNAAFWIPSCGSGMVYGTNKGELFFCHL